MSTTIKLRRGTSTAFSTNNPTLQAGEPAFETDTGKLKIGDGTTAYNSLDYIGDGLKNNTTATNSLAILGTTTGANNTIVGSGSNCSARTNSTIIGASSSATSGNGNILVGYNNSTNTQDVTLIGNSTSVTGSPNSVRIGNGGAMSGSNQGISIGYGAKCVSASHGVAIGYNAEARSSDAIQLGQGTNNTSSTLQFKTYQLVNSSGKIPNDRLNIDSAPTSGSSNTVSSDGVHTALAGKADVDLSNVTDTGYIKMAGASMPSDKSTVLTLGASGSIYTAPADGWFYLSLHSTVTSYSYLDNTTSHILVGGVMIAGYTEQRVVPAKKNDSMKISYGSIDSQDQLLMFIYAVGSESEWGDANA